MLLTGTPAAPHLPTEGRHQAASHTEAALPAHRAEELQAADRHPDTTEARRYHAVHRHMTEAHHPQAAGLHTVQEAAEEDTAEEVHRLAAAEVTAEEARRAAHTVAEEDRF